MLKRTDTWVTAADLYDGDVVTHPVTGETVTIAAMMQLEPLSMIFVAGVVEFDPTANDAGSALFDAGADELSLDAGEAVFRQLQYCPDRRG